MSRQRQLIPHASTTDAQSLTAVRGVLHASPQITRARCNRGVLSRTRRFSLEGELFRTARPALTAALGGQDRARSRTSTATKRDFETDAEHVARDSILMVSPWREWLA